MAGIGGTVIQRSFVANDVGNIIHVATAPLDELDLDDSNLTAALAEIVGAPKASIFSDEEYRSYQSLLTSRGVRGGGSFRSRGIRFTGRADEDSGEIANQLFEDFVLYVSSTSSPRGPLTRAPYRTFYDEPFFGPSPSIDIDKLSLTAELDTAWFYAKESNLAFVRQIEDYDIPLGQSPTIKSDSLLALLETSRKFCVAPLAVGGAQAISQLSQGQYVGALLTTATAGAMTLILIGTVSVGAMLVQRVAQARARRGGEGTDDDRTPTPRSGGGQSRARSASARARSHGGTAVTGE